MARIRDLTRGRAAQKRLREAGAASADRPLSLGPAVALGRRATVDGRPVDLDALVGRLRMLAPVPVRQIVPDLIRPDRVVRPSLRSFIPLGCAIAARAGAGLLMEYQQYPTPGP